MFKILQIKRDPSTLLRMTVVVSSVLAILIGIWVRFSPEQSPPSLYWEEVALGYDAYSLAKTGKDHHGNTWPIIALESFGDWKPTGYVYALIPVIKLFGLNDFAVRLPSRIAGVLLILGVFYLAKLVSKEEKETSLSSLLPWTSAAVIALSSWGVMFSRAAWEVNFAVMLTTWGVIVLLQGLKQKPIFIYLSTFFFAAAAYTYHAHRMIAPLLMVLTILYFWLNDYLDEKKKKSLFSFVQQAWNTSRNLLIHSKLSVFFLIVLFLPLFANFNSPELTQRFSETSIFSLLEPIERSNALIETSGSTFISRIIYHRYIIFGKMILSNFFDHFTIEYLFISGDVNPRHSTGFVGQLYYFDLVLLALGTYAFRKKKTFLVYLAAWMVISILPAALSTATPHALRTLMVLPMYSILIGNGMIHLISLSEYVPNILKMNKQILVVCFLLIISVVQVGQFWRYYTKVYPVIAAENWQYSYKEMVSELTQIQKEYPSASVRVSRELGRPAMYYWFYSKTDPRSVQAFASKADYDQGEFLTFDNLTFSSNLEHSSGEHIYVTSPQLKEKLGRDVDVLASIKDKRDMIIWEIYRVN